MPRIENPLVFGHQLCKILGIDPGCTARVAVVFEPGSLVMIYIQQHLQADQTEDVLGVVRDAREAGAVEVIPCVELDVAKDGTVRAVPQGKGGESLSKREQASALLHRLWGRAVDAPGYNKEEWKRLETELLAATR